MHLCPPSLYVERKPKNELNHIFAHYRLETHFKHKILLLGSLVSFQSNKKYRTGVN